jgi:folylpolyglutamate synthase/dihydropteroate synthase
VSSLSSDIIVTAPAVERAASPAQLASHLTSATISAGTGPALRLARRRAGRDGLVVACGSLYLAAEVLKELGA